MDVNVNWRPPYLSYQWKVKLSNHSKRLPTNFNIGRPPWSGLSYLRQKPALIGSLRLTTQARPDRVSHTHNGSPPWAGLSYNGSPPWPSLNPGSQGHKSNTLNWTITQACNPYFWSVFHVFIVIVVGWWRRPTFDSWIYRETGIWTSNSWNRRRRATRGNRWEKTTQTGKGWQKFVDLSLKILN